MHRSAVISLALAPRGRDKSQYRGRGRHHDFVAQVSSGLISTAEGSFLSVTPGISETGTNPNTNKTTPNAFTLQLNANIFTTSPMSVCGSTPCNGWQQFLFENDGKASTTAFAYMQYWLLDYGATCPTQFQPSRRPARSRWSHPMARFRAMCLSVCRKSPRLSTHLSQFAPAPPHRGQLKITPPEMNNASKDIAIIGMACVLPGAPDKQRYWENILHKVNAIADAPPEWEAELFFEENTKADDRTYCKRGGFLGKLAQFDPFAFGIMPNAVDGGEPDHYMALQASHDALKDCGALDLEAVKQRTAVIIGRGTYVNRGNAAALQQGVMVESILRILKQLHPEHTDAELAEIKKRIKATLPPFNADTSSGLVPNIITGRIANRLDLMGPNYLIDAACASSLVAIEMAARELHSGNCDLALAGGVNSNTSPVLMMIFSQLGALSHRGQLSSFDKDADGTLLGEGVGMVVLKRLAEAERDGNHIYAVLKNIGIASDGRATHVLAPRLEGEELALRRAYERVGIDPLTVGLLEAHGTGTPVGDVVEVEALRGVFPPRQTESPRCALGSVKSMISHTVPAAGVAGLIKAALALHHKVLPPTLCENPNPKLQLEKSNFYINTETRPWIHGSSKTPRRAGVNAFGFGGINAHAILEEYTGPNQAPWLQHEWDSELFIFSGENRAEVAQDAQRALALLQEGGDALSLKDLAWTLNCNRPMGPVRMAVVGLSHTDLAAKLERAMKRLGDEKTRNIKEIEGIYYFKEPLGLNGKLAFLFPGEGSQYRNMLGDLCIHFPEVRAVFDLMDRAYENHPRDYLPSDVIFPPPFGSPSQDRLYNMDSGAETVFCANQAMYALIEKLGIRADAMVGHSTGEHSALLASRVVEVADDEELIQHILGVYEVFDKLNSTSDIPEAVLLAVAGEIMCSSNARWNRATASCISRSIIAFTR